MSVYELGPDEVVIMQEANVSDGRSQVALILTNQNIIEIQKGFFGGDKNSIKYSLGDLRVNNGKPNVLVGKASDGSARLELYFNGFERYYSFKGLLTERKWASSIEKAYKVYITEKNKKEKVKRNLGTIFAPIKGTLENAKKAVTPKPKEKEIRSVKCPKCGAQLSGPKGEDITCDYCSAVVKVK